MSCREHTQAPTPRLPSSAHHRLVVATSHDNDNVYTYVALYDNDTVIQSTALCTNDNDIAPTLNRMLYVIQVRMKRCPRACMRESTLAARTNLIATCGGSKAVNSMGGCWCSPLALGTTKGVSPLLRYGTALKQASKSWPRTDLPALPRIGHDPGLLAVVL